MYYLLRFQ
jgi:hypothetical protein